MQIVDSFPETVSSNIARIWRKHAKQDRRSIGVCRFEICASEMFVSVLSHHLVLDMVLGFYKRE